jgi:hypothetical protein
MPDDAGTWLYFAYADFTLIVAQRESANVPTKSKIPNPVITGRSILLSRQESSRRKLIDGCLNFSFLGVS